MSAPAAAADAALPSVALASDASLPSAALASDAGSFEMSAPAAALFLFLTGELLCFHLVGLVEDRVCRHNVATDRLVTLVGFGVPVTIRHLTTFCVYSWTMYFLPSAWIIWFTGGK